MPTVDPHSCYIERWRTRWAERERALARLRARAREAAARCAGKLRALGAAEVWLFGSLTKPRAFDEGSDIDIGTLGLEPGKVWSIQVEDVLAPEAAPFRIDAQALESLAPSFRAFVRSHGERIA